MTVSLASGFVSSWMAHLYRVRCRAARLLIPAMSTSNGGGRAKNGARAPLFLYLAPSQVPRQEGCPTRLFGGTDHARRIQAGKDRQWHAAGAHRVRLR